MTTDFQTQSYQKHEAHFKAIEAAPKLALLQDPNTADFWRQQRKYDTLQPLLSSYPKASWLTVGDGAFGLDAVMLKKMQPTLSAFPSDISPYLLEYAQEQGIISDFGIENAEKLSFEDNSFDFVFCKEAYHHFPRPMIAFYEMLRVARKAVVLIEPNDWKPAPALLFLKNFIFGLLKGKSYAADDDRTRFETSGNYIYSVSVREMEKAALGLNLSNIAFKLYHDYYIPPERIPDEKKRLKTIQRNIKLLNGLTFFKMKNYNLISMLVFKEALTPDLRTSLHQSGYTVIDLPKNPYST